MRYVTMVLVLLLISCGGDDGAGPGDLEVSEVAGTWTITLESRAGECSGAAAGGDLTLWIDGTSEADETGVLNFVNKWGSAPDVFGDLTGNVNLNTGEVDARLWKGIFVNGAELVGTIDSDGNFSGDLNDPYPGYGAIFVLGSCSFPVTGRRTGSDQNP
jgi:hypothetical protein